MEEPQNTSDGQSKVSSKVDRRLAIAKVPKSRALSRRLEKYYSTETAKDKKKALEDLTADERKFLLMSHAVGEGRVTHRLMTILLISILLVAICSLIPDLPYVFSYPYGNIIYGILFILWIGSMLTALIVACIYLVPILTGKFRQMANTVGSARILQTDKLVTEDQAQKIKEQHASNGIFSKLAVSLTDYLAAGPSLKKMNVQVKQATSRRDQAKPAES